MAGTQPAQGDRPVVVEGVEVEADRIALRVQLLDGDEQVHVVGALGFHPQLQLHVTRQFRVLFEAMVEHSLSVRIERIVGDARCGFRQRFAEG